MNISGFEEYNKDECVTFFAEVYRYINMYELLFSAPHGSTIDYKEENEKIIESLLSSVPCLSITAVD